MLADGDAVSYLHEIVDLRAGADPGFAQRRSVDRGIGADLDIVLDDHAAHLWNFLLTAVGSSREAVAIGPDHGAVLDDHPIPDRHILSDRDLRSNDAVLADGDARPITTCG